MSHKFETLTSINVADTREILNPVAYLVKHTAAGPDRCSKQENGVSALVSYCITLGYSSPCIATLLISLSSIPGVFFTPR